MDIDNLLSIIEYFEILKSDDKIRYNLYARGFDKPLYLTPTDLHSLSKFRIKFMGHTGSVLKSVSEEVWLQVITNLIHNGIVRFLKPDKKIILAIIQQVIYDNFFNGVDELLEKGCAIYNNHIYLYAPIILQKIEPKEMLFDNKRKNQKLIGGLLRPIGFKSISVKIKGKVFRMWNIKTEDFGKTCLFKSDTQLEIYQQPYAMS